MTSVLKNAYPCCGKAGKLPGTAGTYGRRCRPCAASWSVKVARALIADRMGVLVLKATWETRAYRRRTC